jgi:hypothetical protein
VPDENASRMSFNVKKSLGILKQMSAVCIDAPSRVAGSSYKAPRVHKEYSQERRKKF